MVTIGDVVKSYEHRYYESDGFDLAKNTGVKIRNNSAHGHDMFHIRASGLPKIVNDNNLDTVDGYKKLENSGLVDRLIGIKAEILTDIYTQVFDNLNNSQHKDLQHINENPCRELVFKAAVKSTDAQLRDAEYSRRQKNNNDDQNIHYHKNDAVSNLFDSYNTYRQETEISEHLRVKLKYITKEFDKVISVNTFVSEEEIAMHVKRAEELYYRLKKLIVDEAKTKIDIDDLFKTDIKEFSIANFTEQEKHLLRKNEHVNTRNR